MRLQPGRRRARRRRPARRANSPLSAGPRTSCCRPRSALRSTSTARPARRSTSVAIERPKGPRCDAGAVELDYEVRIDSGPTWTATGTAVEFVFSSARPGATFECALDRPGSPAGDFGPCSGPSSATYAALTPGPHTFRVRAIIGGQPIGEAPREFTVGPTVTVTSTHPSPTTASAVDVEFTASADSERVECRHVFPDGGDEIESDCESPVGWRDLVDGTHRFELTAFDDAGDRGARRTVTDARRSIRSRRRAAAPVRRADATFTFEASEPGATFACRLEGPSGDSGFVACSSPQALCGPRGRRLSLHAAHARRAWATRLTRRRCRSRSPRRRRSRSRPRRRARARRDPAPGRDSRPPRPRRARPWSRGRSAARSSSSGPTAPSSSSCGGRTASRSAPRSTPRTGGSR